MNHPCFYSIILPYSPLFRSLCPKDQLCVGAVGASLCPKDQLCAGAVCGLWVRCVRVLCAVCAYLLVRSNKIVSFSFLRYLSFECPRLAESDEKVRNLNRSSFSKKWFLVGSRICLDDFELGIAIDVRSERISMDLDGQNLRSFSFPA